MLFRSVIAAWREQARVCIRVTTRFDEQQARVFLADKNTNSLQVDAQIETQKKYSEELSMAAAQMESLNSLYKVQLESASRNAEANKEIAENAGKLKEQMQSMTANIASLNNVYGGMLSAMGNKG